ncbi:MAG: 4-(cytidine 5'-diphospho)-2-C-methyl-D-erythritol kinase [Candidatus Omnitrophica bacterium]|nr:4-(cytidine 5'-diphospho)-2-C-methyl-D-erythritol kinase [Candidatus Omnitrophota bacterium]
MKRSLPPLLLESFAKINLYLQVLNKRKDNFHDLSTLFCRIGLADTIIIKERKDSLIKIKCSSPQVPKDKSNLCYAAAALLKQKLKLESNGLPSFKQSHKLSLGLEIEIKKRIPVGAGLGGGSSNAASTLLGLNRFWDLDLPQTKLMKLAAELGSDVPFFVSGAKFALGSGRGEKIKPLTSLKKLKLWFILACPNIKVSTPLIYRKFDTYVSTGGAFSRLTRPKHDVKILISELSKRAFRVRPEYLFNSLEPVTTRIYPAVDQVKKALYGIGLEKVMMSGSGPAVFVVCGSAREARKASAILRKKHKSWQIFVSSNA